MTKVHFKGETDDFVIFVESAKDVENWKEDRSIPLAQVVSSFKIMVTHRHGPQGYLDGAPKASLENEFGTSDEDAVITKILEQGTVQHPSHVGGLWSLLLTGKTKLTIHAGSREMEVHK